MHYRKLGKTNLTPSVIGVGTWQFGGEWGVDFTQKDVDAILTTAKEAGINLIDTAECYGDHLSERFIGDFLKRDRREDWLVATKFGHDFHGNFDRTRRVESKDVLKQLDASLKALNTDYIDLYQGHSLRAHEFDNDDLWTMLDKQKQAGKIKHLGLSLENEPSLDQTKRADTVGVEALQLIYNRLTTEPETTIFPVAEELDLGVLARVPLASGYLTGKYKPHDTFKANDVRSRHDEQDRINKLELVEKIKRDEVPADVNMATWALSWCLQHDAVTSVIPGCKTPEQVRKNAMAADLVSTNHPKHISKS